MSIASLVIVVVVVVTVVISVIHVAFPALFFKLPSALLNILSVLSMTINLVLKVVLGLVNAFFAITP
jgi:hypothetical protein